MIESIVKAALAIFVWGFTALICGFLFRPLTEVFSLGYHWLGFWPS